MKKKSSDTFSKVGHSLDVLVPKAPPEGAAASPSCPLGASGVPLGCILAPRGALGAPGHSQGSRSYSDFVNFCYFFWIVYENNFY